MSLSMIVQAFGWLAVIWLITVHLLIHQGRLHRTGAAPRVAGAVAALVIVVASLQAQMWPIFVLGLLWLRSELWHRHSPEEAWFPLPDEPAHPGEPAHPDLPEAEVTHPPHPEAHPAVHPDRHPISGPSGSTVTRARTRVPAARTQSQAGVSTRPQGHADSGDTAHHRRPLISRRVVDVLFRIEITLLIAVTIAAFTFWAYQERPGFSERANTSLCHLMATGC